LCVSRVCVSCKQEEEEEETLAQVERSGCVPISRVCLQRLWSTTTSCGTYSECRAWSESCYLIMNANNIIAGSVDEVTITKLLLFGSFDDFEIILAS
jgi:hypothetical protein